MNIQFCSSDEGRAFYTKGHIPFDVFMSYLRHEVSKNDPILNEQPSHCWMRICRDFQEDCSMIIEAAPESRGSFRVTWIQDN